MQQREGRRTWSPFGFSGLPVIGKVTYYIQFWMHGSTSSFDFSLLSNSWTALSVWSMAAYISTAKTVTVYLLTTMWHVSIHIERSELQGPVSTIELRLSEYFVNSAYHLRASHCEDRNIGAC